MEPSGSDCEFQPTDQEISGVTGGQGLTHIVAQSPALPLLELKDRDFEILVYLLLREKAAPATFYDDVSLLRTGADKGRDVLLRRGAVTGIIQCKRLATKMRREDLITEILRFALHATRYPRMMPAPGTRYEIWTASGLTERAREFVGAEDVARIMREEMPALALRARGSIVSLKTYSSKDQDRAEVALAIEIASGLKLAHVGPEAIADELAGLPRVRRQFFRSPEDGPAPASVREIDMLVAKLRTDQLFMLRAAGRYDPDRYVARTGLEQAFSDFLEDSRRTFVAVGGSGQGKTSWSARLLASPPVGRAAVLIPAEEIASSDRTPVDTIARLLTSRPLEGVTQTEIDQAVWAWLDAGNRVLVVDGLDRVRADVLVKLPAWLRAALDIPLKASVRLILTARRERWAMLNGQLTGLSGLLFRPADSDASSSHHLRGLTPVEAEEVYAAYGVSPEQHRGARLKSPSLVAVFAKQRVAAGEIVTRLDILDAEVRMVGEELRAAGIGAIAANQVLTWLGDGLFASTDGWIGLPDDGAPVEALEVLVASDRLILREGSLRLDSDDLAEALLAQRLSLAGAIADLDTGRNDSIFMGAAALAIARNETGGSIDAALGALLDGAPAGPSRRLDLACGVILELRSPDLVADRVRQAVGLWEGQNLMLLMSGLGRLINEVDMPGRARFDLVQPLIDGDNADDWRDKYWDKRTPGRWVSPFTTAIERSVAEGPAQMLPEIIAMSANGDRLRSGIGRTLLFRAAERDPKAVITATWKALEKAPHAIGVASLASPVEAARFLATVDVSDAGIARFVANRLSLAAGTDDAQVREGLSEAVRGAADILLARVADPDARLQLLITRLEADRSEKLLDQLRKSWSELADHMYWRGLGLLPSDEAAQRLADLLEGSTPGRDVSHILRLAPMQTLDNLDPVRLAPYLARYSDLSVENSRAAAAAAEGMLYSRPDPAPPELEELASKLAASPDDLTRARLTYYAGSVAHDEEPMPGEIARRERILSILITNETGANLSQLVWKIIESAPERPDPQRHLDDLARRFGRAALRDQIGFYGQFPGAQGLDLNFAWARD
jgi:hypothetical protein